MIMDLFSYMSYRNLPLGVKLTITSADLTEDVLDIVLLPCRYEGLRFVLTSQLGPASPMWRRIGPGFGGHVLV
jgi:hypothetical protein